MVKFLQIANQNPPFVTRHPSVLVWFPFFHWQPPSASAPVVPLKLPSQMSPVSPTAKAKSTVHVLTLSFMQDFVLSSSLLLKILPSFGFPPALQPPKSPLTPVFVFSHLISIFPYSWKFLRVVCWAVLSSLFMLSSDDFIYTCSFHFDTGFPESWICSPDLSPLGRQLSRGQLNLYVLLLLPEFSNMESLSFTSPKLGLNLALS